MCFSLFCNVFCTCLHYWYVKIYWAKRPQQEQTHVHTITLHSHEHILLAMMKWFYQTTLLTPCYIFHNCEHLSAGKHNHIQVCTASHKQPTLLFLHFVCFSFFWTFESKFEQNWVVVDTLINNAKHWSTVNKMTVGRQNHIHSGLPQPSDVIIFCFSFTFIMTCSEQMTTVKWQKSVKKWKKVTFWAKLSRICQGPNTYFSILSNFEQNWAKLSRIYRDLPILFLVLLAILSNFEQNWAGFTGTYSTNTFFSIAGNFEQNWAGFTGPTNTF